MKRLIRWVLNHIPRRLLQRVANWVVPIVGIAYKGRGRECPICGSHYRRFMPYGYVTSREDALCPHCLSLERHRMIWLWLKECSDLFDNKPLLLHIAPEISLMRHFKHLYRGTKNYITADLESPLADLHFDIQDIPMKDCSVDVVICNHLMEHVEDDIKAMRELYRIMRRGGWGILLVPEDRSRATTFEDDTITDPNERTRIFGQYDHRRIYGRDFDNRLQKAGFRVERIAYKERLSQLQQQLYAISNDDLVIIHKD